MRSQRRIRGPALSAVLVLAASCPTLAHAQSPSGGEKVTAEALFEDGRQLVTEGKYADACPRFQASEKLDPSVATLLNLASCWEKLGRTATAWATYKEAASAADAAGRKDYVATAQRHASVLVPKLAHLTLTVDEPAEGLAVKRDGAAVDRAEWGVPIPVDTGPHVIEAAAPGRKPWTTTVTVSQDGSQASLSVPSLEVAPREVAPAAETSGAPAHAPIADSTASNASASTPGAPGGAAPSPEPTTTARTIGVVLVGLGVVGAGVGAYFGLEASSKNKDSLGDCEKGNQNLCTSAGVSLRDTALHDGNASSIAFSLGAAALLGGVVLWWTAPGKSTHTSARNIVVAPTLGGAVVEGAW